MRLDDQEPNDQAAEDHQFGMRSCGGGNLLAYQARQHGEKLVQNNRQHHDEGGAKKAPHDGAQAAG